MVFKEILLRLLIGQRMKQFGLLIILTSGHTGCAQVLKSSKKSISIIFDCTSTPATASARLDRIEVRE